VDPRHAVVGLAGASPRTATVDDGDTRLRYHVTGPAGGPPVVLLHGGGLDAAAVSWKHAVAPLSADCRVYALDWPGYGDSDPPASTPTLGYYAGVLESFLDAVGVGSARVAGISLGGGVALATALSSPERVDRLALVGSYGLGNAVLGGRAGSLLGGVAPLNAALWAATRRSRSLVAAGVRAATAEPPPGLVDEAWALARRPGAGTAWRDFQRAEVASGGLRTDFSSRLRELSPSTLLIHGRRDRFVPVEWAERATDRIPEARLTLLDCGHWATRERPEAVNRLLAEFVSQSS
jgi:pimeloyl-ACP methyl ester carboxylesterase